MTAGYRGKRRSLWEDLAGRDPALATDGFNACTSNAAPEQLGTIEWSKDYVESRPGMRVLDIGCGWGKFSVPAQKLGAGVFSLDVSRKMLEQATYNAARQDAAVSPVQAEADAIPLQRSCFDLIWCHSVLMHLSREEAELTLEEIARLLKPSAKAFVHFPNTLHPVGLASAFTTGISRSTGMSAIRRRRYSVASAKRLVSRHLSVKRVWADSMQLFPPAIPLNPFTGMDQMLTGIPEEDGMVKTVPDSVARVLERAYARMRALANDRMRFLVNISKDFVVEAVREEI